MNEQKEMKNGASTMLRMCGRFVIKEHATMSAISKGAKENGHPSGHSNHGRKRCLNGVFKRRRRKHNLCTSTPCCLRESLLLALLRGCSCQNTQETPLITTDPGKRQITAATM